MTVASHTPMPDLDRREFLAWAAGCALAAVAATAPAGTMTRPASSPASRSIPMKHEPLFGPYGSNAIAYIDRFASAGANALWFHGFNPAAFEACSRNNVAACVEFKTFRADFGKHPELVPIGVDGKPIRHGRLIQGVCLSQKEFLKETEAALRSGVRDFRPAGIWLDYLTYAGWFETPRPDLQDSCFCDACILDFCNTNGIDADHPDRILRQYPTQWTRHKCRRIAGFAAHYASIIRAALPGCIVGAYMCPWMPEEFESALTRIFAQDYQLLAPAIDVFTPLIYATKSARPATWGRDFLQRSRDLVPASRQVQLILDVLDFPASLEAVAGASMPTWGVQLFGGADVFQDSDRSRLFRGATDRIRRALAGTA